jgi:hypothetical protein
MERKQRCTFTKEVSMSNTDNDHQRKEKVEEECAVLARSFLGHMKRADIHIRQMKNLLSMGIGWDCQNAEMSEELNITFEVFCLDLASLEREVKKSGRELLIPSAQ